MMRFVPAVFFFILLLCQPLHALEVTEKRGNLTLEGNGPWYKLFLDADIQLQTGSAWLGDIRIIDSEGKEQPYAFFNEDNLKNDHSLQYENQEVALYPLYGNSSASGEQSNIRIEKNGNDISISIADETQALKNNVPLQGYILDLNKKTNAIDMLDINWEPKSDGFYPYRLEISNEMENWRLVKNGELYRLSNDETQLDTTKIELKKTEGRFLRILWQDSSKAPVIKKASIRHAIETEKSQNPVVWSDILQAKRVEKEDKNREVYELSFAAPHLLQMLKVHLPDGYSLAPFSLYGASSVNNSNWQLLRQGLFYQLLGKNGEIERLDSVELPQNALTTIRIVIDKRGGGFDLDSLPVQIALPSNTYVFLARGKAPYHLELGKSGQSSTALDFSALVPSASNPDDSRISNAKLDMPLVKIDNQVIVEESTPSVDWKKLLLWGILIVGIGFLLLIAFQLLRQSEKRKD